MNIINLLPFVVILFVTSCNLNQANSKYIVTTKVKIKSGEIDNVLQLFKQSNPELVRNQTDWVKAIFSKNEALSTVMVQAYWKSQESYLNFSKSTEFQKTMKGFGQYFIGKPSVEINEILFEM